MSSQRRRSVYRCHECSITFDSCGRFNGHFVLCSKRHKRRRISAVNVHAIPTYFGDSDSSVEDLNMDEDDNNILNDIGLADEDELLQPDLQHEASYQYLIYQFQLLGKFAEGGEDPFKLRKLVESDILPVWEDYVIINEFVSACNLHNSDGDHLLSMMKTLLRKHGIFISLPRSYALPLTEA